MYFAFIVTGVDVEYWMRTIELHRAMIKIRPVGRVNKHRKGEGELKYKDANSRISRIVYFGAFLNRRAKLIRRGFLFLGHWNRDDRLGQPRSTRLDFRETLFQEYRTAYLPGHVCDTAL